MRRRLITITAFVATMTLVILFSIFLWFGKSTLAQAHNFVAFSLPISSPAPSPTSTAHLAPSPTPSPSGINWSDPGLLGVLTFLILIFTGLVVVLAFTGPIPELIRKHKERKDQTKNRRNAIKLAKRYRKSLLAESHLINIQILDRKQPLRSSYMPLRLHQEVKLNAELDASLLAAEVRRDPKESLRIGQKRKHFERLASTAIAPVEAIDKYKRCVILGDPGAGKTTLLKYLAVKSAQKKLDGLPDLPIYIELNAFASSGNEDLLDFAATKWDEQYSISKTEARNCMEENLMTGNALLLLDALNETVIGETIAAAAVTYQRVSSAILQIATEPRYRQSSIVVTVRKADYNHHEHLVGFTDLYILDFRPENIEQFVDKWFADRSDRQKLTHAADLNTRLKQNIHMQALAVNPLILSLIVYVYRAQLNVQDSRTELYKQYVDTLLSKWDASRTAHRLHEFKPEHKWQLLKRVAWHFHTKGQSYFPEYELLTVIADFLSTARLPNLQSSKILEELVAEYGLLKEQGSHGYSFLHLTMQEYFVAPLHVADKNELETLLKHLDDPWWKEVILFYVGHSGDISPLLQILLQRASASTDVFHTDIILAGRWLAARHEIQETTLRDEVIDRLFDMLEKTPYSLTRERIVEVLVKIGGQKINQRLIDLLPDPLSLKYPYIAQLDRHVNPKLSLVIIKVLGEHSDSLVVSRMLGLLATPELEERYGFYIAYDMRLYITEALVKLGDPSVISRLLQMLSDEKPGLVVQGIILRFLVEHGESSVAHDLLSLLSDKKLSPDLREHIAGALGKLGERSVAPKLLQLLTDPETDKGVSESIAYSLGKLGERSVVPELLSLLSDEKIDLSIRTRIVYAFGDLGEPSVAPELLSLLSNKKTETDWCETIAYVLGILGEPSVVPELLPLLTDSQIEPDVHARIAITLSKLGERSVIPELLRLLTDQRITLAMRGNVADILGELGERSIATDLLKLLSDPQIDLAMSIAIAKALGELGEPTVAPDLLRLLPELLISKSEEGHFELEGLRSLGESIIYALGKLTGSSVAYGLLPLLTNEQIHPWVREYIAKALGDLGERLIAPELLHLLADPHTDKRVDEGIADALGELGESSIVPDLLQLLNDWRINYAGISSLNFLTDRWIVSIVETLGKLGRQDDESIPRVLLPLLSDKRIDRDWRPTIANVVGQLAKDETIVYELAELLLTSDVADDIHRALWNVCSRARVRVFIMDKASGKELEIVKWEDEPEP